MQTQSPASNDSRQKALLHQQNNKIFMKRWDTMASTYWWIMHLDKTQPQNCVDEMTGYSKKAGFDEAKDKRQMLMRIIVRLYNNRWLHKATHIEFFQRVGEITNKKTDPRIFTISLHTWQPAPELLRDPEICNFFNRFFDYIKNGKDVQHLLPPSRASFTKDDYLDIGKQYPRIGSDELKLNSYCSRLMSNGHAWGNVVHFFNQYKNTYLCKNT